MPPPRQLWTTHNNQYNQLIVNCSLFQAYSSTTLLHHSISNTPSPIASPKNNICATHQYVLPINNLQHSNNSYACSRWKYVAARTCTVDLPELNNTPMVLINIQRVIDDLDAANYVVAVYLDSCSEREGK